MPLIVTRTVTEPGPGPPGVVLVTVSVTSNGIEWHSMPLIVTETVTRMTARTPRPSAAAILKDSTRIRLGRHPGMFRFQSRSNFRATSMNRDSLRYLADSLRSCTWLRLEIIQSEIINALPTGSTVDVLLSSWAGL